MNYSPSLERSLTFSFTDSAQKILNSIDAQVQELNAPCVESKLFLICMGVLLPVIALRLFGITPSEKYALDLTGLKIHFFQGAQLHLQKLIKGIMYHRILKYCSLNS